MYTKRQILVGVIILFIAIGSIGYFRYYMTHYYYKIPKVTYLPSNESSSASPGDLPMWALEDAQDMVDYNKNFILEKLNKTLQTEYLTSIAIGIFYHKANDIAGARGTYADDDQWLNTSVPDIYKYYDLRPLVKKLKLNPRLLLKDLKEQYFIETTTQQQRDIIQKVIDMKIFEMENPIDWARFERKRRASNSLFDPSLVSSTWVALVINEVVYFDNTPKNKATIDAYLKWLEDNYLTELKRHPVDKWPWDR